MSTVVAPENWHRVLKGETVQTIRPRERGKPGAHVAVKMKSGALFAISPIEDAEITATLINIISFARPIRGVLMRYQPSGTASATVYAQGNLPQFEVIGRGDPGAGLPFRLEVIGHG